MAASLFPAVRGRALHHGRGLPPRRITPLRSARGRSPPAAFAPSRPRAVCLHRRAVAPGRRTGGFNDSSPQKGTRSHKNYPSHSLSFFVRFRASSWPTPSGFFPAAAPEVSTIHRHKKAQEVTKIPTKNRTTNAPAAPLSSRFRFPPVIPPCAMCRAQACFSHATINCSVQGC